MTRLQGKVAIVTGVGRSNGIGAAVCRTFAAEGASVFFTHLYDYDKSLYSKDTEKGWPDLFAEELRQSGVQVGHMSLDLALSGSGSQLLEEAVRAVGFPTILVNNATYSVDADFRQLTEELIDAHCAVNIRGTFMLSAEFARLIEREKVTAGGRIINLTSGQGKGPMPGNLIYAATKGAISVFTESLAAELAPLCITVNAVDPGPTDSGWMSEEVKKALLPQFPMGRIGVPDDAARLITFLASDDSQWITGEIIHSRGGF